MNEERNDKIINALKNDIIMTFSALKKGTGLNDGTLSRGLKFLMKTNRVVHEEEFYALTENKDKLKEKVKNQSGKQIEIPLTYQVCRDHTNDLKGILKIWKNEISVTKLVSGVDFHTPGVTSSILLYPRLVPLTVDRNFEKDWRFQHLSAHLPDLLIKWNEFQSMLKQQYKVGSDLILKLGDRIASNLGVHFMSVEEKTGIQLEYPTALLRLLTYLAKDGKQWPKGTGEQIYNEFQDRDGIITAAPNATEKIEIGEDQYGYYCIEVPYMISDGQNLVQDKIFTTLIKLPKAINPKEELKRLDEYKKNIMGELRATNSEYMENVIKHLELHDKLWVLRDELEKEIDKYSSYSVFPNICDVIKQELDTVSV